MQAVTFTESSAYDSDGEGESSATPSTSNSGVILGFDDGKISEASDERRLDVSRIGGQALFPLEHDELPPASLYTCPGCQKAMVLVVQLYAPLSDDLVKPLKSPYPKNRYREDFNRVLHILACVEKGCTGIRCLRSAQRDAEWAKAGRQDRERKALQKREEDKRKASERSLNPFATGASSMSMANPYASTSSGFGSLIFGEAAGNPAPISHDDPEANSSSSDVDASSSAEPSIATLWTPTEAKTLRAHYIDTAPEQLAFSSSGKAKLGGLAKKMGSLDLDSDQEPKKPHKGGRFANGLTGKGKATASENDGWAGEGYEVMKIAGVEEVFLAFQERLENSGAPEQLLRYEFGGTPLPFSGKSQPYNLLFPSAPPPGSSCTITRGGHAATPAITNQLRRYDSSCSGVARCPYCQSPRTFELQIMPHAVSVIERRLNEDEADEKQHKELGWATVWCYVCSADCLDADTDHGQEEGLDWKGWREEIVLVEPED